MHRETTYLIYFYNKNANEFSESIHDYFFFTENITHSTKETIQLIATSTISVLTNSSTLVLAKDTVPKREIYASYILVGVGIFICISLLFIGLLLFKKYKCECSKRKHVNIHTSEIDKYSNKVHEENENKHRPVLFLHHLDVEYNEIDDSLDEMHEQKFSNEQCDVERPSRSIKFSECYCQPKSENIGLSDPKSASLNGDDTYLQPHLVREKQRKDSAFDEHSYTDIIE